MSKSEGVRKSWQSAHKLHKNCQHPGSSPMIARSFLARTQAPVGQSISPEVLTAYHTFIKSIRAKRTRRRKSHPDNSVEALFKVKQFMDQNNMTIPAMREILAALQQLI